MRRPRLRRRTRRRLRRFSIALLGVSVAWLVVGAAIAATLLKSAEREVQELRRQASRGQMAAAAADRLSQDASLSRWATSGPVWWAAAHIPYIGRPTATLRALTRAVDLTATQALPAAQRTAEALRPAALHPADRTVAPASLQAAALPAWRGAQALNDAVRLLDAVKAPSGVGTLDRARDNLARQCGELARQLAGLAQGAEIAPKMLGSDGPRRYLVAFQNNAEARGTGGLAGSFAVISADHGTLTLLHVASRRELGQFARPVLSLGGAFETTYEGSTRDVRLANLSPDFPVAARIWSAMWERRTGERVDGVLAIDPFAAADLIGPARRLRTSGGLEFLSTQLPDLVERRIYALETNDVKRDRVLVDITRTAFAAALSAGNRNLLAGVRQAVDERRLLLWSAHEREQTSLHALTIGGELSRGPEPVLAPVVINITGGKLDYYLRRKMGLQLGACIGGSRTVVATVDLRSVAPASGLPAYVTTRADGGPVGRGADRLLLRLYTNAGTRLVSVLENGVRSGAAVRAADGLMFFELPVELRPGDRDMVVFTLDQPARRGHPRVIIQPLADEPPTKVLVESCD